MPIGANIFVIAAGAILTFATDFDTPGFNVPALGAVLMVVGAVGLIMRLMAVYRQRQLAVQRAMPGRSVVAPPVTAAARSARLRRTGTVRRTTRWTRRGGAA